MRRRIPTHLSRRLLLWLATALVTGALLLPPSSATGTGAPSRAAASGAIAATVDWNGKNVDSAATPASAITTPFSSTVLLQYYWHVPPGGGTTGAPRMTISDARFQFFFLGLALDTRDQILTNATPASNGTFTLGYDPGVFRELAAGIYGATASLLAPNGTTMWSESFFVHVEASYTIVAVVPIFLIAVVVLELHTLFTAGRANRVPAARSPPKPAPVTPAPESVEKTDEAPAEDEEK